MRRVKAPQAVGEMLMRLVTVQVEEVLKQWVLMQAACGVRRSWLKMQALMWRVRRVSVEMIMLAAAVVAGALEVHTHAERHTHTR